MCVLRTELITAFRAICWLQSDLNLGLASLYVAAKLLMNERSHFCFRTFQTWQQASDFKLSLPGLSVTGTILFSFKIWIFNANAINIIFEHSLVCSLQWLILPVYIAHFILLYLNKRLLACTWRPRLGNFLEMMFYTCAGYGTYGGRDRKFHLAKKECVWWTFISAECQITVKFQSAITYFRCAHFSGCV